MNIVSNCPLCEEHSLHVSEVTNGTDNMKTLQCVNCGYASADQFLGSKDTNEAYKSLHDDMRGWAKETDGRIWVPSIITLPTGMLYPVHANDDKMKWAFAPMVKIPEEEQKNYPAGDGNFYKKKFDTDNPVMYNTFLEAISDLNESAKAPKVTPLNTSDIKLPKLKKVDG